MIYLDMDGPLTRFHEGAFKLFGVKPDNRHSTEWYGMVHEVLGVTKSEVWARINKAGEDFWSGLEPTPWARDLYDELARADEVVILTSPGPLPAAASGKTKWLKKFFGGNFKDYIITRRKELLAKPGDVLVDDMERNVDGFTQAGGIGLLFPCTWNREAEDAHRGYEKTLNTISQLYTRYTPPESVS